MPIYEYRCTKCSSQFEILRAHDRADEPAPCHVCSAPSVRMISTFARGRADKSQPAAAAASSGGRCGSCSGGSCAGCR